MEPAIFSLGISGVMSVLQIFIGKGSHHLKKIYFMKKFHKTGTPPPRRGFMKAYFLGGGIFWDIYIVL